MHNLAPAHSLLQTTGLLVSGSFSAEGFPLSFILHLYNIDLILSLSPSVTILENSLVPCICQLLLCNKQCQNSMAPEIIFYCSSCTDGSAESSDTNWSHACELEALL